MLRDIAVLNTYEFHLEIQRNKCQWKMKLPLFRNRLNLNEFHSWLDFLSFYFVDFLMLVSQFVISFEREIRVLVFIFITIWSFRFQLKLWQWTQAEKETDIWQINTHIFFMSMFIRYCWAVDHIYSWKTTKTATNNNWSEKNGNWQIK